MESPKRKPTADLDEKENNSPSTSSVKKTEEVPLVGKDSEWVGIKFCKQMSADAEEREVQVVETDEKEIPPLFLMFPNLKAPNQDFLYEESTTDVTKMLVGHRANFANLKPSKQLRPRERKLEALAEEETDFSDSSKNRASDCSEPYDIELDEDDLKPKHKKRRKTKSDLRIAQVESSHFDLNEKRAQSQSKQRLSRVFSEKKVVVEVPSSQESFGDDERDEN